MFKSARGACGQAFFDKDFFGRKEKFRGEIHCEKNEACNIKIWYSVDTQNEQIHGF